MAEKPVEEVIAPISQPQVRAEEPKEQIKPTLYDKLRVYLLEQLDIRLPAVSYTHLDVYKRQV